MDYDTWLTSLDDPEPAHDPELVECGYCGGPVHRDFAATHQGLCRLCARATEQA